MGVTVKNFLGGVGGLSANIYVTGLLQTDSVSAVSPSGKTIQAVWGAYLIEGVITQCYKISASEYGTYNITAVRDDKTTTAEVLVDVATEYVIPMAFITHPEIAWDGTGLWLRYNSGGSAPFIKVNEGMALCGASILYNGGYYSCPLLVSKNANAVTYSASGVTFAYMGSVEYDGEIYYYCETERASAGKQTPVFSNVQSIIIDRSASASDYRVQQKNCAIALLDYYFYGIEP